MRLFKTSGAKNGNRGAEIVETFEASDEFTLDALEALRFFFGSADFREKGGS
jgi:hypothetical protein